MYNPITFIKDVIDILKDGGPGKALCACPVTPDNRNAIILDLGIRSEKYANIGDFLVEFERSVMTIVPAAEFHKHYALAPGHTFHEDEMVPIITIKPL